MLPPIVFARAAGGLFPAALLGFLSALAAPAFAADRGDAAPKPETYLCPHADKLGVDCFLDAVEHLYTMCRVVKSMEILEFGYDKADEGTNGAKTAYCIDKHKASIARPFQAALREAAKSRPAVDALKGLHESWTHALLDLKWQPPESDEEYKGRVTKAYDDFRERAVVVRTALATPSAPPARAPQRAARAPQRATGTTASASH